MRPRRWGLVAAVSVLLGACTSTNTTLRFTGNREAVMVRNPEKPKGGNRLEALIGTRKKIFFFVPRNASVVSFQASIDPVPGGKKLVADLSVDHHSLRIFVVQLRQPLPSVEPPTAQNKTAICSEPTIAKILGGAPTEIVGVGRGSWIATSSSARRLFVRPIETDLVILVDANSLDSARASDFILRMGSLTFESR
jgi:hypothetical protein